MLDIRLLRSTPEIIAESQRRRGLDPSLDSVIELDRQRRALVTDAEALRAKRNSASKEIGAAKARGEDATAEMAAVSALGDELKVFESKVDEVQQQLDAAMQAIPNIVEAEAPIGGEDDGTVLRTVGNAPAFDFEARDHLDLASELGLIDMERGARTSGSRFAYLMGDLVRVQFALVQYALDHLGTAGFQPVVPPVLVREEAMWGTGFFPADKAQIYRIPEDNHDLFLVGTSEVPLAALHADEILELEQLPIRYAGVSPCFRREAGSAGKDTRGIFRVHQFDKVEMFSFVEPDPAVSRAEHEYILAQEEAILGGLGLHYQVVDIAAGDLGSSAARKFDNEVWLPGQGRFRELTSCSNCTDYQARRLKARVRRDKQVEPVHTLNGTAIAIGRMLVALIENGQQEDGSIALPDILTRFGSPASIGAERVAVR